LNKKPKNIFKKNNIVSECIGVFKSEITEMHWKATSTALLKNKIGMMTQELES
jgi:hypothetical protein